MLQAHEEAVLLFPLEGAKLNRRDVAVLLLFFIMLACTGIATAVLLIRFFPIILVIILALIVVAVVAGLLLTVIGLFVKAFGAIFYAIKKKPEVISSSMKIEEVRVPENESREEN